MLRCEDCEVRTFNFIFAAAADGEDDIVISLTVSK